MDSEKMELDNTDRAVLVEKDTGSLPEIPAEPQASLEQNIISEPSKTAATSTALPDHAQTEAGSTEPAQAESPKLTSALEALLGGLDTSAPLAAEVPLSTAAPAPTDAEAASQVTSTEPNLVDVQNTPVDPPAEAEKSGPNVEPLLEQQTSAEAPTNQDLQLLDAPTLENAAGEDDHPEWEIDSSPIESSSDDSSSDDSSSDDDSDEGENAYKLLSPEEQARILMEEGGGSDDEGGKKGAKGAGAQLRTKNEMPEVVIPKPDVTITEDMPIEELGNVEAIVDNILLIRAKTSGEYRVLESGSVLCLADRSIIGAVSETLGRVQQPLYSVLFTNAAEVEAAGLSVGTKVFYSDKHATYVFTQALKAFKGSDASNLHDEEVGADEMEFSDDEAEMEHKRKIKQQKLERRGGKMQQSNGPRRGGHPLQQQNTPYDANTGVNYDDGEDDGPYKPLSRPAGYADSVGRSEAPQEESYQGGPSGYPHTQSRDQSRGRGRGDRGRGRGDRGRGRGGNFDRRGGGHSLPQGRANYPPLNQNQNPSTGFSQPPFQQQGMQFPPSSQAPQNAAGISPANYSNMEYSPHSPQLPNWPQFPPQLPFQQPFQQPFPSMQNNWPVNPAGLPGGTFINPAFFNNPRGGAPPQWGHQGQQNGRGGGSS